MKKAIRHQVIFDLRWAPGSPEALAFLAESTRVLGPIPGVRNFTPYRQVSGKNDYQYGFSMDFDSRKEYDAYSAHPDHVAYVRDRWQADVTRFLEIDFQEIGFREP